MPQAVAHGRHAATRARRAPCASVIGLVGCAIPIVLAWAAGAAGAVAGRIITQTAFSDFPSIGAHLRLPCAALCVAFCAQCLEVVVGHDLASRAESMASATRYASVAMPSGHFSSGAYSFSRHPMNN